MDIRMTVWLLLLPVMAIAGSSLMKSEHKLYAQMAGIFIVILPLWFFLKWASLEMAISLETVIAAYYLLLAVGLYKRDMRLITVGLIVSLLSRYTLIFWIPLFGYLLLLKNPVKYSLKI